MKGRPNWHKWQALAADLTILAIALIVISTVVFAGILLATPRPQAQSQEFVGSDFWIRGENSVYLIKLDKSYEVIQFGSVVCLTTNKFSAVPTLELDNAYAVNWDLYVFGSRLTAENQATFLICLLPRQQLPVGKYTVFLNATCGESRAQTFMDVFIGEVIKE